ncbi:MAG: GlsB/YeaQ/YmgE family stress response membrane protein [Chloroflexota bacterium]
MSILAWIVLGLIAGLIAGMLMKGGGYGIVGDIVLGILGAIVGGWLTGLLLGRDMMTGFNIESLVVAVLGAIVLIGISRLFTGRRASNRV